MRGEGDAGLDANVAGPSGVTHLKSLHAFILFYVIIYLACLSVPVAWFRWLEVNKLEVGFHGNFGDVASHLYFCCTLLY